MRIGLGVALLIVLSACVKPHGDEYKSSELTAVYARTVSGGTIICDAYYYLTSDSTHTPIQLETDAFVTCNGTVMTRSGAYYSGSIPYVYGSKVAISLIRQVDGSAMTDTEIVY